MFITKPFIRDRKIRFALVGCGRISANHFDALDKHADRAELVGVCDIDAEALAKAEARTGAPGFRSLEAMLAGTDADIVIVATPSGIHAHQAVQIAAAGRHVMTEKPMATNWQDGKTDGPRLRRGRGAPLRGQAEPPERYPSAASSARSRRSGSGGSTWSTINVFWSPPAVLLRQRDLAGHLGVRRRRLHEPGEPLRRPPRLADRTGGERPGLHRDAGAQHPGRGHRRRQHPLAHRRARLDERHDADLPEEPRGVDHDHRRERDGARWAAWR